VPTRAPFSPSLLSIVPPYQTTGAPPLGAASLLAYLRANGCDDFDFLDLRLLAPNAYAPTYRPVGVFGESYAIDIPDLPLLLRMLRSRAAGRPLVPEPDELFERYCLERGISSSFLHSYLSQVDGLVSRTFSQIPHIEFIGFSVWTSNLLTTLLAAAHLKRRRNPPFIVLGGPQVTESQASAQLALRSGLVDAVVLGEGEETLLRLYEAFRETNSPPSREIPGTLRLDSATGRFERSERPLLRLPSLPLPAFDRMPLMAYQSRQHPGRTVSFELSRGCTDKCSFCSEWVFWKRIRVDEVEHCAGQLEQLVARFKAEKVVFMDSLLNASMSRLRQFAEEILSRGLQVRWGGFMRANMDDETAALLKRAGCDFVFLGIESLSDETLERMNKRRSEADNLKAIECFLRAGFRQVVAGCIPGFPGDSRERFLRTALALRAIHRRYPHHFRVNVEPFTVSPAQPIYADLTGYGLTPRRWDEAYLDLAPEYHDLTDPIVCQVEGANQGLDRLGELRASQILTTGGNYSYEPDPYLYAEGETLADDRLTTHQAAPGWFLGRVKTPTGLIYGLILSQRERESYEGLMFEEFGKFADFESGAAMPLLARQPYSALLAGIERRHLVRPRRRTPRPVPAIYQHALDGEQLLTLSPSVVARRVEVEGEGARLLVVDFVTNQSQLLGPELSPLFERLADAARSLREIVDEFGGDLPARLDAWKEQGIVVQCRAQREPLLQLAGSAEARGEAAGPSA
jgi:radical SAM superfamily enzyme YgiQ (UPF0313 family)